MKIRFLSALLLLIGSFSFTISAQGPIDYLNPPTFGIGNYFTVSVEDSWAVTSSTTVSTSKYLIDGTHIVQKITLSPDNAESDPSAYYKLPDGENPKDVTGYNRIRFDIWLEQELDENQIYFALCSPNSSAGYKILRKAVPAITIGNTQKWITVDFSVDDLDTYWSSFDKNVILAALEQIRFTTLKSNTFNKTFYVNNIYFYTQAIDDMTPAAPAYLPPVINNAAHVISAFSDSYTNTAVPSTLSPQSETIQVKDNDIWKFNNTGDIEISYGSSVDVSDMTHLHLDVWTKEATDITVSLNNSSSYPVGTTAGEWLRLDIPLSGLTNISSVKISGLDNKAFFVDNLYFYKDQAPFNVDISDFNTSLGKGINFGDIFDFNNGNWDPDYMQMVADLGFSHVRLPVNWESYQRSMDVAPYNIDPDFLNTIKDVVDLAIEKNLKIIVNMHHHTKVSFDPSGQEDRFVSQWTQIADFFRYYPDNLIFEVFNEPSANNSGSHNITPEIWNDLLVKGLQAIRSTNPTRPVLIAPAKAGGISGLSELQLPATDDNLIVTVHYYNPSTFTHQGADWSDPVPPVGTEWLDTESDRTNVETNYQLIDDFVARDNRPIHIGEFGAYEKADMDSRVRWTTYIARYNEQKGYSWAYWDFDAKFGIYDPVNKVYRQPLVDALLKNPIPPKPIEEKLTAIATPYDSNNDGTDDFSGYGYYTLDNSAEELVVKISDGKSDVWNVQVNMPFSLQNGKIYRVTFTVSANIANGAVYQSYFQDASPAYVKYSPIQPFSPTTTPITYSYAFIMNKVDDPNAKIYFDLGGGGANPQTITLRDIKIEEVEVRFEPTPIPSLDNNDVDNIYSSVYSDNKLVAYSESGKVSEVADSNDGQILLFSGFDEQTITLPENLFPGEKKVLHLDAYAGSPLDLVITLTGNVNKTVTYPLASHQWTSLDIDLSDVLTGGKYINSIKLSGGTGSGRKLYLDNLYFYQKNESGGQPDEDNRNIWLGTANEAWDNPGNWSLKSIPDANTIVYLPGNKTNYPVLKDSKRYVCKEIYFLPGAQLGRSDLLTYEKVHIQMNAGLENSEQQKSPDIDQHLKYAAQYSAEPIARDRWYMLSMPLHTVFAGDLSFGGYPGTDIRKMEVAPSASGNVYMSSWKNYYTTLTQEFKPAEGLVFRMNSYRDEWPYLEYGMDDSYRRFGLEQVNGIIELPYYNKSNMSRAHRIHKYEAATNTSVFSLLSSSGEITEDTQAADRGDMAYRFAFEGSVNSPNVVYRAETAGQGGFVLVGNPYMSVIDFDKFYEDNKERIRPLYQLWTGNTFVTYNVATGGVTGEINEYNAGRYIAPMQSFVVQLKDMAADGADLVFNIKNITPEKLTVNSLLRTDNAGTSGDAFTITATNNGGSVQTLIITQAGGSSVFSELEGSKLMATIGNTPDIYLLKPSIEGKTDLTGVPYVIAGDEQAEIPLALATGLKGKTVFTFAGMNRSKADITFMDIETGFSRDITGMGSFEYEFDYTPPVDNDNSVIANEDRFRIRFVPKTVGTEQIDDMDNILVYKNEGSVHIMTVGGDLIRQVNLYDIQGRVLFKDAGINEMFYTVPPQGATYPLMILEVITNKEVKRFKVR